MNSHLCGILEQEGELKEDGGAVPGSRDGVGGQGPAVGWGLGTDMLTAGCLGWVRYGACMSPGLVGMNEGYQGV